MARRRRLAVAPQTRKPTEREKIRAGWEGETFYADVVAGVPADAPLEPVARAQALASLLKGYGPTIANAVLTAADGCFDDEYPVTLRAWWIAVGRELRGQLPIEDRALKRLGVATLGRIIL